MAGYHGNGRDGHVRPDPFICPQNAYCPEGSAKPTFCDDGKWTPGVGAQSSAECIPCPRGYMCKFATMAQDAAFDTWMQANADQYASFTIEDLEGQYVGISSFYKQCNSGYICYEGSTTDSPTDGYMGIECPEGHYCSDGDILPIPCPPGSY